MHSILIIEDDPCLGETLKNLFNKKNYGVTLCTTVDTSYQYLEVVNPDLVIADRVLPDGDGIEVVEFLRDYSYRTKVLMLSKKCEVENRVEGLKNGADDYLNKPFSSQELLLRVTSLLNKNKVNHAQTIEIGPITLFYKRGEMSLNGEIIKMRKRETDLLHCILTHHGTVITRQQIIDWIWGCSDSVPTRAAVDVYIKRLRDKLGEYGKYLTTVRGYGYKIKLPVH